MLLFKKVKLTQIKNFLKYNQLTSRKYHKNFTPLYGYAKKSPNKVAITDNAGSYTFGSIFKSATELSREIIKNLNGKRSERVMFLCSNNVNYVTTLWAIWMSGQIAVPLSHLHPENLLLYYANDTNSKFMIASPEHATIMDAVCKKTNCMLYVLDSKLQSRTRRENSLKCNDLVEPKEQICIDDDAMILYTSGTTGNPKGVVLTTKNLLQQTTTLIESWKWSPDDVILHTLPLHHVHGTVNALFCPLFVGAKTVMLPKFSAATVWEHLLGQHPEKISVFMAVPTIYSKLIEEHAKLKTSNVVDILQKNVRLMVSGSAPLPTPVYNNWLEISGHRLLERYGMTEIGMCLSNTYVSDREPGYVGTPLPGVSVRLSQKEDDGTYTTLLECSNDNRNLSFKQTSKEENPTGELLVKGQAVFKEYFNKLEATQKEFTEDGWFKTGDMCQYVTDKKRFRMLGRTSVDIIKSGGYKISALQIETVLLGNPDINECVILGVHDQKWGEKVAALVVPVKGKDITLDSLRKWASGKLPKYSLPSVLRVVDSVPKNAMGKVNKKELVKTIFS